MSIAMGHFASSRTAPIELCNRAVRVVADRRVYKSETPAHPLLVTAPAFECISTVFPPPFLDLPPPFFDLSLPFLDLSLYFLDISPPFLGPYFTTLPCLQVTIKAAICPWLAAALCSHQILFMKLFLVRRKRENTRDLP